MFNAISLDTTYDLVEIYPMMPALYAQFRLDRSTIPSQFFVYDVMGGQDGDSGDPATITAREVRVDFCGTLICPCPIHPEEFNEYGDADAWELMSMSPPPWADLLSSAMRNRMTLMDFINVLSMNPFVQSPYQARPAREIPIPSAEHPLIVFIELQDVVGLGRVWCTSPHVKFVEVRETTEDDDDETTERLDEAESARHWMVCDKELYELQAALPGTLI
jgi:hypothetical protein